MIGKKSFEIYIFETSLVLERVGASKLHIYFRATDRKTLDSNRIRFDSALSDPALCRDKDTREPCLLHRDPNRLSLIEAKDREIRAGIFKLSMGARNREEE
jgi:hypothetical protein